jgi:hypothetical protein
MTLWTLMYIFYCYKICMIHFKHYGCAKPDINGIILYSDFKTEFLGMSLACLSLAVLAFIFALGISCDFYAEPMQPSFAFEFTLYPWYWRNYIRISNGTPFI